MIVFHIIYTRSLACLACFPSNSDHCEAFILSYIYVDCLLEIRSLLQLRKCECGVFAVQKKTS